MRRELGIVDVRRDLDELAICGSLPARADRIEQCAVDSRIVERHRRRVNRRYATEWRQETHQENTQIGTWIVERLNRITGPNSPTSRTSSPAGCRRRLMSAGMCCAKKPGSSPVMSSLRCRTEVPDLSGGPTNRHRAKALPRPRQRFRTASGRLPLQPLVHWRYRMTSPSCRRTMP